MKCRCKIFVPYFTGHASRHCCNVEVFNFTFKPVKSALMLLCPGLCRGLGPKIEKITIKIITLETEKVTAHRLQSMQITNTHNLDVEKPKKHETRPPDFRESKTVASGFQMCFRKKHCGLCWARAGRVWMIHAGSCYGQNVGPVQDSGPLHWSASSTVLTSNHQHTHALSKTAKHHQPQVWTYSQMQVCTHAPTQIGETHTVSLIPYLNSGQKLFR